MTKGTASFGKHSGPATHTICRRCGSHSYFKRKGFCSSCGYGRTARLRTYNWNVKIRAANGNKARNGRSEMFKRKVKGKHTKKH
ncbi:MAG: 50S ribosomal protein L37e [Promethearchaeota archaeon]